MSHQVNGESSANNVMQRPQAQGLRKGQETKGRGHAGPHRVRRYKA